MERSHWSPRVWPTGDAPSMDTDLTVVNSKSISHDEVGLQKVVIALRPREGRELVWSHSAHD